MVRKLIRTGTACLAVLLVASAWNDGTLHGQNTVASVSTNKFTYLATENVVISGSGFGSGENVTLAITQIGGGLTDGVAGAIGASFSNLSWDPADTIRGTFLLTATGQTSAKVAKTIFTVGLQTLVDDAGPDDLGGQKDLSFLTIDYGIPNSPRIVTTWGWDDTAWTGGNTGDACTLFDVNSDGDADYSLCVTVAGQPAAYQSTRMYRCGPAPTFLGARSDRCSQPTLVTTPIASSGSLTTPSHNSDPFGTVPAHSQGNTCGAKTGLFPCAADDTVAALVVQLSDINNQSAKLINICSYPSQEPNSNPSDCVITPNSGFLTIKKESSPTSGTFTFNTSTNAIGSGSQFSITTVADGTVFKGDRQLLSFPPTTPTTLLGYVRENVPSGWTLSNAACVIQTGGAGTATGTADTQAGTGGKGVSNIEIREGLETVCTFVDARDNPSLTLTKNVSDPYSGAAAPSQWTLTATNTSTSVAKTFATGVADTIAPGTYRLAESGGATGYSAGPWSCTSGGNAVTLGGANADELTVESGKNVSCSITNTAQPATLVVKKIVTNDNGGNKHAANFSFNVSGVTGPFVFAADPADPTNVDKGSYTLTNLAPGSYTVTEVAAVGYDAPGYSNCSNVSIPRGGSATCTITNNDSLATPGSSTVQRVVVHDSINITGVKRGATQQAGNNTVTFKLYLTNTCDGAAGNVPATHTEAIALNLSNAGQTDFTVPTVTGYLYNPGAGVKTGSFYWRVTYSGDAFNGAFTTPCGSEKTTVTLDPN